MADVKREAALTFKTEGTEQLNQELDQIIAKLERIESFCGKLGGGAAAGAVSAGAGVAAPVLVSGGAPAGLPAPGQVAPGAAPTFAAAADPSVPLEQPPQGTPQQARAGSHPAASPTISPTGQPVRPGATTGLQPPAVPSERAAQQQLFDVVGTFVGRLPGGGLLTPFLSKAPTIAAAGLGAYLLGSYLENLMNVETERAAAYARGRLITPEREQLWREQQRWGWIPVIGPRWMQVEGALLEAKEEIRRRQELLRPLPKYEDLESLLKERVLVPGDIMTAGDRVVEQWIRNAAEIARDITTLKGIFPTAAESPMVPWLRRLYELFPRSAPKVTEQFGQLAGRPEYALDVLGLVRRFTYETIEQQRHTQEPALQALIRHMRTIQLMTGDVSGLVSLAPVMEGLKAGGISAYDYAAAAHQQQQVLMAGGYTAWSGYHQAVAAELTARGATGENVFAERVRAAEAAEAAAERLRGYAATAEGYYRRDRSPAAWAQLAGIRARAAQAEATAAQLRREAGFGLIEYRAGIVGAQERLAEIEGRSPAAYMEREAGIYYDLLRHPERYLGPNVSLSPRERLEYRVRARGAELGAIQAQMQYESGIALARERWVRAELGVWRTRGMLWTPGYEHEFERVGEFIRDRIEAIDEAITKYAAKGLTEKTAPGKIRPLLAEKAELRLALEQVQLEAFETKYSLLAVPITTAAQRAGIAAERAIGLGQAPEALAGPFAAQLTAAREQAALAEQRLAEAVRRYGPQSIHALQAQVELEQARAQLVLMPFQQEQQRYALAVRPLAAYGAGLQAAGAITTLAGGTLAALPETLGGLAMLGAQLTQAQRHLGAIQQLAAQTPGGAPALVAEAWQGYQQARYAVAHGVMAATQYQPAPGLQERLEQAQFGERVLASTMTARGSIRAMARERMQTAEEMMEQLARQRDAVLAVTPPEMREQVVHLFGRQMRALAMERVSAQQELEQGWLERVVSSVWNAPENVDLVLNAYNYAGAVMRGGVRARHLGSTSADLDYYRMQAINYYTYGGAGRFSTPLSFLENALSGVTEMGGEELRLPPLGRAALLGSAPPQSPLPGMGGTQTINLNITIQDPSGAILGAAQHQVSIQNDYGISIVANPYMDAGWGQAK